MNTLDQLSGSWICTGKSGKVLEVWERKNAEILESLGWKVEIASEYLGRINREIREEER